MITSTYAVDSAKPNASATATSSSSTSTSESGSTKANANVDKNQFLQLLVAQMRNQDPLNPVDNKDFTAQMAQFSSLEQLMGVNDQLKLMLSASNSATSAQAVSLIGKDVTASGHNVHVNNGEASAISFELPRGASAVTINIEDSQGNVVRTIENGAMNGGSNVVEWDGKDQYGTPLTNGLYSYSVSATDVNGEELEASTYSTGTVTGVSFENNVAYIHIGDLKFMLSEIMQVNEAKGATAAGTAAAASDNQGTPAV